MSTVQQYDPQKVNPSDAISLSDSAISYVKKQISKRGKGLGIKLTTKKSGCAGFAYVIDIVDEVAATDFQFVSAEVTVFVSQADFPIVKGTRLDYVTEGLNSRMVFQNPNQTGSCGCGESFSV